MRHLLALALFLASAAAHGQVVISQGVVAQGALASGGGGGGAFSFVASCSGTDDSLDTDVACSGALNVASGDLLVAMVTWEEISATTVSITDGGSNTFTFDTGDDVVDGANHVFVHPLYRLSGVTNSSATFTATLTNQAQWKRIFVMQFRPGSGETVTKDISGTRENSGTGTAITTGTFSTTGTDNVVCGMTRHYASGTRSNPVVAGSAAGQTKDEAPGYVWCRIVSSALTTQTASVDYSVSDIWAATAIAFKSE